MNLADKILNEIQCLNDKIDTLMLKVDAVKNPQSQLNFDLQKEYEEPIKKTRQRKAKFDRILADRPNILIDFLKYRKSGYSYYVIAKILDFKDDKQVANFISFAVQNGHLIKLHKGAYELANMSDDFDAIE